MGAGEKIPDDEPATATTTERIDPATGEIIEPRKVTGLDGKTYTSPVNGHATRAIAPAVGTSHHTVSRDRQVSHDDSPGPIEHIDRATGEVLTHQYMGGASAVLERYFCRHSSVMPSQQRVSSIPVIRSMRPRHDCVPGFSHGSPGFSRRHSSPHHW